MNPLIRLKQTSSVFIVAFGLACFTLVSTTQAQLPPPAPDGGYPNQNTAEGDGALFQVTPDLGIRNTAIGFNALNSNTTGFNNTATGDQALYRNTTGYDNTATGYQALFSNTTGRFNTAMGIGAGGSGNNNTAIGAGAAGFGNNNTANGYNALASNQGNDNTAIGSNALSSSGRGSNNTAIGYEALFLNTAGVNNTATGFGALRQNTAGNRNTASGINALAANTTGQDNTADGHGALGANTTGSFNLALGTNAGGNLTTGSNNIDIGALGVAGESDTTRIGSMLQTSTFISGIYGINEGGTISTVYINSNGQLGTQPPPSSRRFKKEIKSMDKASEAILSLKPVTFQYRSDSNATPQFGLIAEEVAAVNPDLIVREQNGEIYTVRYDAVNAMLLNEFLKEHRTVQELKKQVAALTAVVQKVSAQLEVSKSAPQTVLNNH